MRNILFIIAAIMLAVTVFAFFLKAPEYVGIGWAGLAVGFAACAVNPQTPGP